MTELIIAEPQPRYDTLPPLVVDCSVIAALVFNEAGSNEAQKVMEGKALYAPWLIDHELISVTLKKLDAGLSDIAHDGLLAFSRFPIIKSATNLLDQVEIAQRHSLSAYDAAYLQLAAQISAPLATFDRKLGQAARKLLG